MSSSFTMIEVGTAIDLTIEVLSDGRVTVSSDNHEVDLTMRAGSDLVLGLRPAPALPPEPHPTPEPNAASSTTNPFLNHATWPGRTDPWTSGLVKRSKTRRPPDAPAHTASTLRVSKQATATTDSAAHV